MNKRFMLNTTKADEEFSRKLDRLLLEYSAHKLSREAFIETIAKTFMEFEKNGSLDTESRELAAKFINYWMTNSGLDVEQEVHFEEIENKLLIYVAQNPAVIVQNEYDMEV